MNALEKQPLVLKLYNRLKEESIFSHAYIIETNGNRDSFEITNYFAKLILCEEKNGMNCNCKTCCLADSENHPDFKIIKPELNTIKKEQLIELQQEFSKTTFIGTKKVYIILDADKMSISSANSILKFLEEPKEGVTAFLVTSNRHNLLQTVLSRCQVISLHKEKIVFNNTSDYLINITQSRSNESIFENEENINNLLKFVENYESNREKCILYVNKLILNNYKDKVSVIMFLTALMYFYKDVLNLMLNKNVEIFIDYIEDVEKIKMNTELCSIINRIGIIKNSISNIESNSNINLVIDRMIIEMGGIE